MGNSSHLKDVLIADNIITDELIAASENIILLEMLSEGKIDKAVSHLNSKIDRQILLVNNFLPINKNLQGRIIADKIFLKIAKYRKKNPRKKRVNDVENSVDEFLTDLLKASN
ncbi:MAG: hypothetical protein HF978_04195 [Desulfobacteraceae bacterium]|nr:hypothetical protein [Desulfobacteraceae bacterium]MBC2754730.1 hypothetical protein [Desulfobacteraceae bacterium]